MPVEATASHQLSPSVCEQKNMAVVHLRRAGLREEAADDLEFIPDALVCRRSHSLLQTG